jgi:hypothetical protein
VSRDLEPDLEPVQRGKWPRRVTVVGYLVVALVVIRLVIHGIHLPW